MTANTVAPARPFLLPAAPLSPTHLPNPRVQRQHGTPVERVTLEDGQLYLVVQGNILCSRVNAQEFDVFRAETGERLGARMIVKRSRTGEYLSCAAAGKSWTRLEDAVIGLATWAAGRWAELDARTPARPSARSGAQAVGL